MIPSEKLTVSAIARRSGLDRRTIERALIDVAPVATDPAVLYDVPAVQAALARDNQADTAICRLAPFGNSLSRLTAWNVCARLLPIIELELAGERESIAKMAEITPEQATLVASHACAIAVSCADAFLANFSKLMPTDVEADDLVLGCRVPGLDAEPNDFRDRGHQSFAKVVAMHADAVEAINARTKKRRKRKQA